jgi:predicted kinase
MTALITCHFLIGLPGSGKSTFANILAEKVGGIVVSTDKIRGQLCGDEAVQGSWSEIEAEALRQIEAAVAGQQPVIYDATNVNAEWRTAFFRLVARLEQIRWMGWYLELSIELCKQRNEGRDRQVPIEIIEAMARELVGFVPELVVEIQSCRKVPLLPTGGFDLETVQRLLLDRSQEN